MKTRKLYYADMNLSESVATVEKVQDNYIVLDESIFFPEGGGQVGDTGTISNISSGNNDEVKVVDTQSSGGDIFLVDDFPTIKVNSEIKHFVDWDDISKFKHGDKVRQRINFERRKRISFNHTALHLLFIALDVYSEGITKNIVGTKINEDYGRFDLRTDSRLNQEDISILSDNIRKLASKKLPIILEKHNDSDEAWFWKYGSHTIPCGGTHVESLEEFPDFIVRRRRKGKNIERVIFSIV